MSFLLCEKCLEEVDLPMATDLVSDIKVDATLTHLSRFPADITLARSPHVWSVNDRD